MEEIFIPPDSCNVSQLIFLTIVYGYCLLKGSSLISDGSELLLLVPSISGMVGSVVLPVLGAVPDSFMVLFSGLSENPQATVAVGVGALAGSTIMLLTVPWFLSILGGRVSLDNNGSPVYAKPANYDLHREGRQWEKLMVSTMTPYSVHLKKTGVSSSDLVRKNGIFMIGSAMLYLVVQLPASVGESESIVASSAWFGAIACTLVFLWYLVQQYRESKEGVVEDIVTEARVEAIRTGNLSLLGAMRDLISKNERSRSNSAQNAPLLGDAEVVKEMRATLAPFFKEYEGQSRNKRIGKDQMKVILRDLQMGRLTDNEVDAIFGVADRDRSGHMDFDEFVEMMLIFVRDFEQLVDVERFYGRSKLQTPEPVSVLMETRSQGSTEEEESEMPEDLKNLTPEQQQRSIKIRAAQLMFFGTLLVLVFSDPAVAVLNEIAVRANVNPFYVSFVLAPLASNASEVIASFNYAQRKTKKTIQVALTTLEGAACLNNSLCLAVFLAIVAARGLQWTFTAEVISILFVQVCVGFFALRRKTFTLWDGVVILALYPVSLVVVALLKTVMM